MRTKRILLIGAAAVMALMAATGTLALFSAATAPTDTHFAAGTVSIGSYRDMGDSIPGPMFYTTPAEGQTPNGTPGLRPTGYWLPGDTFVRALFVENHGTEDLWLMGVGANMHPGTSRHLAEKLQAKVTTDLAGVNVLVSGTLADLIDAYHPFSAKLALPVGPAPRALYFHVTLPLDADNSYQNETLRVDFDVNAEQMAHNP